MRDRQGSQEATKEHEVTGRNVREHKGVLGGARKCGRPQERLEENLKERMLTRHSKGQYYCFDNVDQLHNDSV